ncbi:MAG TPA: uridine kinase [Anaerolineae bacterium]|nr:uridine kinase [Anaerolineae bacterium]
MSQTDTPAPRIVIGVSGGTGSGKTTVVRAIVERIGADRLTFIQQDSYYRDWDDLPPAAREHRNFDHPDSLETELLIEHLKRLRAGQPIDMPVYDFRIHSRTSETRRVEPKPVILLEGILIFVEQPLRDLIDVKIFVDTDADLRFIRRLQRDMAERGRSMDSVIHQYLDTVRPMHLEFVEPSKRYADLIIPEGGFNTVALDVVAARIERMLGEQRMSDEG